MVHEGNGARGEILARLDVASFYERHGATKVGRPNADGWQPAKCPFHEDRNQSFAFLITEGAFKCFTAGCVASGGGGSPFDFLMMKDGIDFTAALRALASETGVELDTRPDIPESLVDNFHARLLRNADLMRKLRDSRGWEQSTLARFKVGFDGQRVTIPVFDERATLRNVRRYLPKVLRQEGQRNVAKFLNYTKRTQSGESIRYGEARIFNLQALIQSDDDSEVIICAGEPDAILLAQYGFLAVTSTGGEGTFFPNWARRFKNKRVTVIYDNDTAGIAGAERTAEMLFNGNVPCKIARLPAGVGDKGDVTDFFMELGGNAERLRAEVLASAELWQPEREPEEEIIETTLAESSSAELDGKPIRMKVIVSGKDTTPFKVPKCMRIICPADGRKSCTWCGIFTSGGDHKKEFSQRDPEIISFANANDTSVRMSVRSALRIAQRCDAWRMEVDESQNMEEVRLIPELDRYGEDTGEREYVQRIAYYLGQGLRSNQSYIVQGNATIDPRSQYATTVFRYAEPAQDSIASFEMTEAIAEELRVFQAGGSTLAEVRAKFHDICVDMENNVTRIFDRHELQTAYDLVWHSVLSFRVGPRLVPKGWVECLIIGDTAQGKSDVGEKLLAHYGLGDRVQAESTSFAGLVGGVEQTQNRWMLTWGKMPLNDRRMLIVEELTGFSTEDIGKLSDVRSTGIAEITKMRTERTNARCRLVFTSNTREGVALAQMRHGVEAVKSLFGQPEDVRRLDFAIAVAAGEVAQNRLDQAYVLQGGDQIYSAQACKRLILWAWSRNASQVRFTQEAIDRVLHHARAMSTKYSAKIPLVESNDQRSKLARLAAAAAARLFSHDPENFQVLLVDAGHVDFVAEWLDQQYSKPSFAYHDYSELMDSNDVLTGEKREEFVGKFKTISDWEDLVETLRTLPAWFKRAQLVDAAGWDRTAARDNWRRLVRMRAIIATRGSSYACAPFFIEVLRDLRSEIARASLDGNGQGQVEIPQMEAGNDGEIF